MNLEFTVHNVDTRHDRDGNPYVRVVLDSADPMAMTLGQYKFKQETIKVKINGKSTS